MLAFIRIVLMLVALIVIFVISCLYSLIRPRHRDSVYRFGRMFAWFSFLVGLKVEVRYKDKASLPKQAVYISNHQSNCDMVTLPYALRPGTVTIGKKSLVWIPLFGQIYWLSGNILINRDKGSRAAETLRQSAKKIRQRHLSVWMFPEGTRSYGKALLPFKAGAFHLARAAKEMIVPVCCSSTYQQVKLNRWNNGRVIIEVGQAIDCSQWRKPEVRTQILNLHQMMEQRICELTIEARGNAADYSHCMSAEIKGV
ncbi:1-acylglycerol-3-phosphate O-acyltransferase [Celerinatantimonas sp. MCCC 1A17872]|uniref:1-acylglycerol-3-phosphate O-acyltransferase n=1 Tax=Celerinatantimonas sp. MCCC 1A17872 TaxID=3177514 RepID=UPI0038CB8C75